jgi:hypothetical protein
VIAKVTLLKWSILVHRRVIKTAVMWLHILVVSLLMCVCRTAYIGSVLVDVCVSHCMFGSVLVDVCVCCIAYIGSALVDVCMSHC